MPRLGLQVVTVLSVAGRWEATSDTVVSLRGLGGTRERVCWAPHSIAVNIAGCFVGQSMDSVSELHTGFAQVSVI